MRAPRRLEGHLAVTTRLEGHLADTPRPADPGCTAPAAADILTAADPEVRAWSRRSSGTARWRGACARSTGPARPSGRRPDWPPALRTAVELLLRSQLPMYVAAGPRWSLLYNDAYAPMLGARHPDALAAAFADAWPEVWPGLQPVLADALAGKAVFQEDMPMLLARRGWPEEAWFTYSLSAIGGEEPGADGVFCACTETTAQVVGERRLRALGELAELGSATDVEAAGAAAVEVLSRYRADVPAALLYLVGDDGARLVAAEGVEPGGTLAPQAVGDDGFWRRCSMTWRRPRTARSSGASPRPCRRVDFPGRARCVPGCSAASSTTSSRSTPPSRCRSGSAVSRAPGCSSPSSARTCLDDEYRAFLELVGHHVSTAASAAGRSRPSAARRRPHRAGPRQDCVLRPDQRRVPHAAHAGARTGRRAARRAPPGSGLRIDLELVHRNAQRLRRMVDRLLELSRLYAGQVDPHFEPVDLAALTAGLAGMFRSAADHAGLTLELDCPGLGEPAFVDRSMWEQVVVALLARAVAVGAATGRIDGHPGRDGRFRGAAGRRPPARRRRRPTTAASGRRWSPNWWGCSAVR